MNNILKKIAFSIALIISTSVSAQSYYSRSSDKSNYLIKAKVLAGSVLPVGRVENYGPFNPMTGAELSWEILSTGENNYEHYWHFPAWGISLMFMDYGHPEVFGQAITLYPYMNLPLVKTSDFFLNAKIGAGLSVQTKINNYNNSYIELFGTVGLEMGFKLKKGYSMFLEGGGMIFNNCDMKLPSNSTIVGYGALGMRYQFNERQYREPRVRYVKGLPWNVAFNIGLATGLQDYHFYDHHHPIFGTFHIDAVRRLTNCYALGGGLDVIYDSKFVAQGTRDSVSYTEKTAYKRYFIENNNISNKFRVGISICNQFMYGRFTGIIDLGLYVYDPIRNAYPEPNHKYKHKRPIVYPFDPNKEDGWGYMKIGGRLRLVENLSLQIVGHVHPYNNRLEIGLNYALPQKRKLQI